jgi:hypothetical protein
LDSLAFDASLTAFPNLARIIGAVARAKAIRLSSSRGTFRPCGECEDCADNSLEVVSNGLVVVFKNNDRVVRLAKAICYERWRREE